MKSWLKNAHKSPDPIAAEALARAMSDLSEDYECAGWLMGLEFVLWAMLNGGSRALGMGDVSDEELEKLRSLHQRAHGWIYWSDNSDPFKSGEAFEATPEWERRNAAHMSGSKAETTIPSHTSSDFEKTP